MGRIVVRKRNPDQRNLRLLINSSGSKKEFENLTKKFEMLLALNKNDTIGFNSHFIRGFSMEDLKQAAIDDPSDASGDGYQPTRYDVLFGRGKVSAQKQRKMNYQSKTSLTSSPSHSLFKIIQGTFVCTVL